MSFSLIYSQEEFQTSYLFKIRWENFPNNISYKGSSFKHHSQPVIIVRIVCSVINFGITIIKNDVLMRAELKHDIMHIFVENGIALP